MNHQQQINPGVKTVITSVFSLVFSVIASSHHWLHMGILLLLGGSTSMMATMAGIMAIRRFMIIATLVTTLFSIYRLTRHRHMSKLMIALTVLSSVISIGFIIYTIANFGW